MADDQQQIQITILLTEYQKLKDEQIARIGFRDNLIYATLVAIGGVLSYALSSQANYPALLVLPLATIVLGWVYLNNDRKISLIGQYIRAALAPRLREAAGGAAGRALQWEHVHRVEASRLRRKVLQMIVTQMLFVGAGLAAALTFIITAPAGRAATWLAGAEIFALLVLAVEVVLQAELRPRA